jgi:hypothetical protein
MGEMSELPSIGLIGGGFQHAPSSTLFNKIQHFKWAKDTICPQTFFIDNTIIEGCGVGYIDKFAWLVESKDIIGGAVDFVKNNVELVSKSYKYLFTHQKEIYDLADNFIFTPSHCTWIENPQIYPKTKLVSMISSSKGWTEGHRHRLGWVEKLRGKVDLYGRGFNEIAKKEDGLIDYMFSIVIENDSYPTYYSEKILDAFATGTVPVYYGAPDISDYFNKNGIVELTPNFDINSLTPELYYRMADAIKDNFREVKAMGQTIEDDLWLNYIRFYFEQV